jgi:N-acetylglucosamine kinase-like BadF-type ATPase
VTDSGPLAPGVNPAALPGGTTPPNPSERNPAVLPGGTTPPNPSERKPAVLAIDGGNSKTAVALVADDGTVLASLRGPGASQEAYGIDGAMRLLGGMVEEVAGKAGLDPGSGPVARHTSACLAGADLPEEEKALTAALDAQGWSESAVALNDTFAVLRAGADDPAPGERAWGAAVTCGAGINCVAVAPDGQVYRYLSFGLVSGDLGGGYWLGQQVMWHAIRAEDGRGPATALAAAAPAYFGLATAADVAIAQHKGKVTRADLLRLTTVLFDVADAGDTVAREVLALQAEEICVMAVNAMRQIGLESADDVPVALGGGVLEARNDVLLGMISSRLRAAAPGALPRVVDVPPVAGAALLGLDECGAGPAAALRLKESYRDS